MNTQALFIGVDVSLAEWVIAHFGDTTPLIKIPNNAVQIKRWLKALEPVRDLSREGVSEAKSSAETRVYVRYMRISSSA